MQKTDTAPALVRYINEDRGDYIYRVEPCAHVTPAQLNALRRNLEALVKRVADVNQDVTSVTGQLELSQDDIVRT